MEEPTKYTRKPTEEPARRYVTNRITPRAGADVVKTATTAHPKPHQKPAVQRSHLTKPALPRTKRSQVLRRQMVERAVEQRTKVKTNHGKHLLWYGFACVVLGAFLIVVWSFRDALPFELPELKNTHEPRVVTTPKSDNMKDSLLDEEQVSEADIEAHKVAPEAPRVLKIPSIGVAARIKQVGTTLSNEPIAPKSIYDVGWYEGSSKLDTEGAVLLNGHLSGSNKPGIFQDVQTLQAGDQIIVERGDGKEYLFIVSRLQEYTGGQIDMSAAINSIDPSKKGLNLVTTLNKYSGTEKRVIVFALLQTVAEPKS